nr:PREDICTED: putative tRNA (cytidine(32)/guanosine(34)-2'-O)-methyltransferase isoform X1 [Bemisia tabaci]
MYSCLLSLGVKAVVDLCAAPGGWSQVLSQHLCRLNETTHQPKVKIVSVDVQEMAPHQFLEIVQGDITKINTVKQILEKFNGNRVDCVVCDGAPDVTGNNDMDLCLQEHLLSAAYAITCCILKAGGSFVAKIFRGKNNAVTLNLLRTHFSKVLVAKPRCSRNSSIEAFVVCADFQPRLSEGASVGSFPLRDLDMKFYSSLSARQKTPFVACGKEMYDSDRTYSKQLGTDDYVIRNPAQSPISPPYAESIRVLSNKTVYFSITHGNKGDQESA